MLGSYYQGPAPVLSRKASTLTTLASKTAAANSNTGQMKQLRWKAAQEIRLTSNDQSGEKRTTKKIRKSIQDNAARHEYFAIILVILDPPLAVGLYARHTRSEHKLTAQFIIFFYTGSLFMHYQ